MTNRLVPLTEPFADDIGQVLSGYPQQNGYLLSLFRIFANSLRFLKKGVPNLLDKASPLPLRMREIVILRTTANCDCEYEWGVHVTIFAHAARFNERQVAATREAIVDPELWSAQEANLIVAIDQLCAIGKIGDETLETFQKNWTVDQQLEIFALCGTYHTISFVANSARLANEPFGAKFPAPASLSPIHAKKSALVRRT